jgi:hypothetical protein
MPLGTRARSLPKFPEEPRASGDRSQVRNDGRVVPSRACIFPVRGNAICVRAALTQRRQRFSPLPREDIPGEFIPETVHGYVGRGTLDRYGRKIGH